MKAGYFRRGIKSAYCTRMAEPDEKSKPAAPDSNPLDGMLGFFNSALAFLANTNPADEGGVTVTSGQYVLSINLP